jgi:hypothetical protein
VKAPAYVPARDDVPKVSGSPLINQRKVMEEMVGAATVARALAKLPRDLVSDYESLTPLSWFPVSWFNEVLFAVAAEVGRNPIEFHSEITRISAERTFSTVWRLLLRFASAEAIVQRTPVLYSRGYTHGELTAKLQGSGRAELTLSKWPDIHDLQIRSLQIATAIGLKLAGFKDVKVIGARGGSGAFFIAAWRP